MIKIDICKDVMTMMNAIILFILAGFAEIGGGYLIWLCLRDGKPLYWGVFGGIILVIYGVIATFQSFPSFGRVYAAYGGELIEKHRISMIGWEQLSV